MADEKQKAEERLKTYGAMSLYDLAVEAAELPGSIQSRVVVLSSGDVRYPCVKPVGFPNHLLSPSLPAPSLSGPVTSGEGRLQVHFAQWGESVGGTKSHPTRARGSDQETALAEPRRLHPKRQRRIDSQGRALEALRRGAQNLALSSVVRFLEIPQQPRSKRLSSS